MEALKMDDKNKILFERLDQRVDILRDRLKVVEHENISLSLKVEELDKQLKDTNEYCYTLEKNITRISGVMVKK
jgi:predicted  nucleic acid-binding Zn-ribbon protein